MSYTIILLATLLIVSQTQNQNDEVPTNLKSETSLPIVGEETTTVDLQYVKSCTNNQVGPCECMYPLQWNNITKYCQVDCSKIDLSTGKMINRYQCDCIENANWNLYYFKCYYDCSLYNKKIFSATYQMCVPDCNQIDFAYGPEYMTDKGVRCHCQTGYKWSWGWQSCIQYGSSYTQF